MKKINGYNAWGGKRNTTQEYIEALDKRKYKCSCGHSVIITYKDDYCICNWCGRKVLKDKRTNFKDKLRKAIYRRVEE